MPVVRTGSRRKSFERGPVKVAHASLAEARGGAFFRKKRLTCAQAAARVACHPAPRPVRRSMMGHVLPVLLFIIGGTGSREYSGSATPSARVMEDQSEDGRAGISNGGSMGGPATVRGNQ